jgi:TetR/AcrR family tetracycline transcriptional repressor
MREDGKRPALTRQMLIDTAMRLLNEVGLEGLTVRRLAAGLGVQSPALYWHIRTKQELLDGIADAIVRAPGMGPPRKGEDWRAWLMRRGRAYRQSLLAHRDGARIVSGARLSAETVALFDEELAAMVHIGFTPAQAMRTISAVTHYVTGFVLREQSERQESTSRPAVEPIPPTLLAAIQEGGNPLGEEAFEYGLRALIDGIPVRSSDA